MPITEYSTDIFRFIPCILGCSLVMILRLGDIVSASLTQFHWTVRTYALER